MSIPPTPFSSDSSRKIVKRRAASFSRRRLFPSAVPTLTSTCDSSSTLQVLGSSVPVRSRSISPLAESLDRVQLQSRKNNKRKTFRPISEELHVDTERVRTPFSDSDSALLSDQSLSPSRSRSIRPYSSQSSCSVFTPESPRSEDRTLCRSESQPMNLTIDLIAAENTKRRKLAATPMPSSLPHRFFVTTIPDTPVENKGHILPTEPREANLLNPISAATLAKLLSGGYSESYDELFIFDCRFLYEYQGGHIRGAINMMDPKDFMELLFPDAVPRSKDKRVIVIFHCEYSKVRGPRSATYLRSQDRKTVPLNQFPNVHFPDVYVLKGGYKNFYNLHPEFCTGGYTPMDHTDYRQEEIAMHRKYKSLWGGSM